MKKLPPFLLPAVLLVLLFLPIRDTASGDGPDRDPTYLVTTDRMQIGDNPEALIWTFGKFRGDVPLSIGVSFTDPALDDPVRDNMFTAPTDGVFPYSLTHLTAPQLEPARVYNLDFPDKGHKEHNTGSPEKMRRNYNMRFPEKVRSTTPFDHMGWFANAQGHAPLGVFDVPHVDVHFFTITVEDREAISGQLDDPKLLAYPPAGFLPADFCLPTVPPPFPPPCKTVPNLTATDIPGSNDSQQGLHWVDQFAPELRGEPFRQIFIFGSYDGKVNFWEPMITQLFFADVRSFLTDLQSTGHTIALTFDIKQPEQFLVTSYYPTQYTVHYDADLKEFSVSLDNFVLQKGTEVAAK
jgi:hypothetical protein